MGSLGNWGGWWGWTKVVWCRQVVEWGGLGGGFPFKILYKQFVTNALVYESVDFGKFRGILGVW